MCHEISFALRGFMPKIEKSLIEKNILTIFLSLSLSHDCETTVVSRDYKRYGVTRGRRSRSIGVIRAYKAAL